MKKVGIGLAVVIILVMMTAIVRPGPLAPEQQDVFADYLTFWSGDLRIFTLTGNASISIYNLDTGELLDFSDPRIASTNFATNPFVLQNQGDAFEGLGGIGAPDQEIRVRIVASDALDSGADRPILVWTGSLDESLRHPPPVGGTPEEPGIPEPPETDNPWMSYLFGLPQSDSPIVFSRKLGRAFLGFTSREMYLFARKGATPTEIVIQDLITNTDLDDDDSQTLGPTDAVYNDAEIEIYYLDQFEDDTVIVTSNVDISAMVGISSRVADDWTVTPPSYAIGDDGFKKGTLFYTFVRRHVTVFPLEDNTTVTITDLSDGDDSKTINLSNGDTTGPYDFYTPVLESDTTTNGPMLARPNAPVPPVPPDPIVTILSNNEEYFDDDYVKIEADKPILIYVGPVSSDWNEFADFSFTSAADGGNRISYVYAQNFGESNDLQIFSYSPTNVVTITSLTRTNNMKQPAFHDFTIGGSIGECPPQDGTTYVANQPWCEGTPDGGVWWGSGIWSGELLRIESVDPVTVLNGDYDTPHFGAFVPFFVSTGSIEVKKVVTGVDGDTTSFDFDFNGESFSLTDGGSQLFEALRPDSYTITEMVPDGWMLAEISCNNGTVLPNPDPTEVTIDLDLGQNIVCTFTNEIITAVDLASFKAQAGPDSVTLEWATATEVDNEGFNVWRSEMIDGPYAKLNSSLIPAEGSFDTGASYTFTDDNVATGVTYYYKLEDIDVHGAATFHGPVAATPTGIWRIYVPIVFGGVILSGTALRQRRQV
jgi:hypothetical protein